MCAYGPTLCYRLVFFFVCKPYFTFTYFTRTYYFIIFRFSSVKKQYMLLATKRQQSEGKTSHTLLQLLMKRSVDIIEPYLQANSAYETVRALYVLNLKYLLMEFKFFQRRRSFNKIAIF